ncbi:MAG: LysR substrate-binding domain-containing protein [Pseudonocardia sp.]
MTTTARLRAFVQVADHGSVRRAAEALVVTESSVSAAVSALAAEVGVALLEKDGRGVRLTAAGKVYAAFARQILGLHAQAVAAARSETRPEHGLVRLAAVTTAGEHVLPELLASFRREYPGVDLRLDVASRDAVWRRLMHREVDVVVAGRPPADLPVAVRATSPNTLVVVGAPGYDVGAGRATWLLREPGSGTRATCLGILSGLEADPPQLTLGSHGATVAAAVAGLGVTLVSEQAVAGLLRDGALAVRPVPGTPLWRPWHLVSGPVATASAELLVAHILGRPGWRPPPG